MREVVLSRSHCSVRHRGASRQQQHLQLCKPAKKLLGTALPLLLSPCPRAPTALWSASLCHRHRCMATSSSTATATDSKLRVTLETKDISSSVEFSRTQTGERTSTILVSKVKPGSVAEQEGLKMGQRLLAISNPSQPEDLWTLNERPSLRYVLDAIRLTRNDSVTMEVSGKGKDAASASREPAEEAGGNLMDNIVSAAQSERSMDSQEGSESSLLDNVEDVIGDGSGKEAGQQTIAEKLESAFKEEEDSVSRERKQIEQRKQRRRDYMERESTRDNTKLAVGLAAAFFLPAIGILTYAFSSGMMDRIGSSYRY